MEESQASDKQKILIDLISKMSILLTTLSVSLMAAGVALAKLANIDGSLIYMLLTTLIFFGIAAIVGVLALGRMISVVIDVSLEVHTSMVLRVFVGMQVVSFILGLAFLSALAFCTTDIQNAIGIK